MFRVAPRNFPVATFAILFAACGTPPAPPPQPPTAVRVATPAGGSCFLLYEMGVGEVGRSPAEACTTRVSPASTFKIAHALAALDASVLSGPDSSLPYTGALFSMLGADRERAYLERLDYGNRDASSGLTTFWLGESLRISPEEQERFLVRLYEDQLPVSRDAMRSVREVLVQPPGVVVSAMGEHPFAAPWPEGTVVGAKTGRAEGVSWLVGHVERGTHAWVFVSCVVGEKLEVRSAIDLAATSLQAAHVL